MASQTDLQRELERWKDKYFEQGEQFDEQKSLIEEYASLMQRILVRVSLAAEQTSEQLDNELASLRTAVRSATPEQNDLEKRLKRIDKIILATDETKQQNAIKVAEAFDSIVSQLLDYKLSRKPKSGLKKLAKSLNQRTHNPQEYPDLLREYAELQRLTLDELLADAPKKEEGFFSRLLGGGNESKQVDAPEPLDFDNEHTESDLELELESEEESGATAEELSGFSSVARHVRNTLRNLLDQLSFPDSARREVARLRDQIEKEIVWYELGPTLDELANLILSVVGKGQRDFSDFLKTLDERLSKVQDFLLESQVLDDRWNAQNQQFDQTMRTQVDEMSISVGQAVDIDQLKFSISEHLDRISSAVDKHEGDAKEHQAAKEQEVKALKEKIAQLEEETAYIRKRLKEERDKALKDALTQLPNREAYDERFELEIERFKRYKKPTTLVVADIDFFKKINDNYGHLSGDKVLQIMAKEVRKRIRKTDFVARYGGEEFVILLPETDLETAKVVIDKVREMVGRLPFHFRDEKIQITMSFGLAQFEEGLDQGQIFEHADTALYKAKENGRNRVEIWSDAASE